jgi:hypothetical protein
MISKWWARSRVLLLFLYYATLFACMLRCNHGQQIEFRTASDLSWKRHNRFLRISPEEVYVPHAAHYDSTPAHDKSGTCVHVDVCYAPHGWNGYKFWMIFTPYRSVDQENPNLLVSNDGRNWSVPPGLTNPIDTPDKAGDHLSDPDLLLGYDGKLYAFYRVVDSSKNYDLIFVKSSKNGITWSTRDTIFNRKTEDFLSPAVIAEDGRYTMWYVDRHAKPYELHKRTSTTPNGAWSESTVCNIQAPPGLDVWHIDVTKVRDQYLALVLTTPSGNSGTNGELWLAVSSDGNSWTFGCNPLLEGTKVAADWDGANIYRSSGFWLEKNGKARYALWYVGGHAGKNPFKKYNLGYTEIILGVGVTEGVFQDFFWDVKNPRDSVTVCNSSWDYKHPVCVKIENGSSQEHQIDTLIFSGVVPSDGLPKFFDSSYIKIDSILFGFKTSSSDTSVSGVKFRIFKQRSWNSDTISLYGNSKKEASATANTWSSVSLPGDSAGLVSPGDIISFWLISNTATNQNVTIEAPRLYYIRDKFFQTMRAAPFTSLYPDWSDPH